MPSASRYPPRSQSVYSHLLLDQSLEVEMAHDPLHDVETVEGGGIVDRQEVLGEFGANSIELLGLLTLPGLAVFSILCRTVD
jgi:hypothetical protein